MANLKSGNGDYVWVYRANKTGGQYTFTNLILIRRTLGPIPTLHMEPATRILVIISAPTTPQALHLH